MRDKYMDGILRRYSSAKEDYQTPIKRLSENKTWLVGLGLPLMFFNDEIGVDGEMVLTERGEIVVSFNKVNHKTLFPPSSSYLIDVPEYLLENLQIKSTNP